MQIDSLTAPGPVWSVVTRTLTSLAANFAVIGSGSVNVAAGAVWDPRPAAGKFREYEFAVDNATSAAVGHYDGTTFTAENLGTSVPLGLANTSRCYTYKNGDSGAHNILFLGWEIS